MGKEKMREEENRKEAARRQEERRREEEKQTEEERRREEERKIEVARRIEEENLREEERRREERRKEEEKRMEEERRREEEGRQIEQARRIEEEKRRDENMRRVLGRLMHGKTLLVFETWHSQAMEQRRMRVACSRIVYKLKNRGLDAAFVTWCDHVDQQKMERAEEQRREEERRREVEWTIEEARRIEETRRIEEEKRRDENMRRVLGRLMHGKTLLVFETWHSQAMEQRRMRVACSRIVYKLKNRGLDAAFVTWCDHVDQQKMERAEEQRREEQRRKECLIGEGDNLLDGVAPALAHTFDVVLGTNLQAEMVDIAMRRKAVVTPEKKLLLARLHDEAYREQQGSNGSRCTLSPAGPTTTSGSLACFYV